MPNAYESTSWSNFYPRPPRGGRLYCCLVVYVFVSISIHALREEGDSDQRSIARSALAFLSTPSARRATLALPYLFSVVCISIHALREEGDGVYNHIENSVAIFLSTPSARRATCRPVTLRQRKMISIHALREEGDHVKRYRRKISKHFYPRPPRGGRLWDMLIVIGQC